MERPLLSLCMIVRDEEATLERSLASFAGLPDELIVVDTGSQDRTLEIARGFGARIERFEWRDDFSAARNYACSLARGEWLFTPDGDELLQHEGVKEQLRALLRRTPERLDKILIEQRTVLDGETLASILVDRLFRNRPELRWRYRIHEVLETPAERTAMTRELYLLHEPWSKRREDLRVSEEREAMYERALRLDRADHPDDPRPAFYLASTLYGAGRPKEALEEYERYFELSAGGEAERRAVAFRDAAAAAGALGDRDRQRRLLFQSLQEDWRPAETYLALTELAEALSRPAEALHWLTIASRSAAPGDELWSRLAALHRAAGDEAAARACEARARAPEPAGRPRPQKKRPRRR